MGVKGVKSTCKRVCAQYARARGVYTTPKCLHKLEAKPIILMNMNQTTPPPVGADNTLPKGLKTDIIYNEDCITGLKRIPDESIDAILTDPPYKYLKGQKLEVDFDEEAFFSEVVRVLKPKGFIVCFGRGTSFYRWNTMMADKGLEFKEEIVWDKCYTTSPLLPINRLHETASIHSKGGGTLIRVKVPYLEQRREDLSKIFGDIKRLRTVLNNPKELKAVREYLETGELKWNRHTKMKMCVTTGDFNGTSRCVSVIRAMRDGLGERSVIRLTTDRKNQRHPTQNPVRLFERLLNLVCKEGAVVLDPFIGSGTTALACLNTKRHYIGYEIDKEYYGVCMDRINEALSKPSLFNQK